MQNLIQTVIDKGEQTDLRQFLSELKQRNKPYLLRNDIVTAFSEYCKQFGKTDEFKIDSYLSKLIVRIQEIIIIDGSYCIIIRPRIAEEQIFHVFPDLTVEPMSVQNLLDLRDRLVDAYRPYDGDVLELDFRPFYDYTPKIRDPKNIGKGVQFLNRYMSSKLFQDPSQWLVRLYEFLKLHQYDRTQLLINGRIQNEQQLSDQVKQALGVVSALPPEEPYSNFCYDLQDLGFEPGWGNTASRIQETLEILDELIDSPEDSILQEFISRIPMIFKVVLVSVHGWFAQEGVLGRPDTGGQVVYVLDQARSLEQEMQEEARLAGLGGWVEPKVIILTRLIPNADGTLCNQALEKVHGTQNAWILRVPFREFNSELTKNWISRFEIWPYLETFTVDAEREIRAEFQGLPDLIIGNYSDGNLVASLLSRRLGVTQCNIAHALEKSKYLFSNLYWKDLEDRYHFSLQFTADLIAMNSANFIVSSTYQEIVGRPDSIGQYESYKRFTMPDLYHVVHGIELLSPKFNVVPPGVNESAYFPFDRVEQRDLSLRDRLETLLFTAQSDQIFGHLDDPGKRPLFSMARLDRIKNLTGLAECFGRSPKLQEHCNLILIAGKIKTSESADHEEIDEIEKLYRIIDQYHLHGKIRWLGVRLPKEDSGEVYRVIADRRGIFVQPALFEAFGLTILEAMVSGLPTFATRFGGPLEIIQDQVNGFYINPTHLEEMAEVMIEFVEKCDQSLDYWQNISQQAIDRVYSSYTWKIHSARLVSLAKIYGFWNYTSKENREDLMRYIEMLFYLLYKPRAQQLLAQHIQAAAS